MLDNPIPRPLPKEQLECDNSKSYHSDDTCYPLEKTSEPAWNLAEIFGRPIRGDCPITGQEAPESTTVCINVPSEREILPHTEPSTPIRVEKFDDGSVTCYAPPPNGTEFNIILPEQNMTAQTSIPVPRIHAFRSITGYGQERGGIQAILSNPSATESLDVIYLESLPWYMKPYLHTLRSSLSPPSDIQPIRETYYRPALDRHRGTHLELGLTIPPASSLSLTYDFEKAILRYTEYPPDANRGFDVPAAVIRILPSRVGGGDSAGARRRAAACTRARRRCCCRCRRRTSACPTTSSSSRAPSWRSASAASTTSSCAGSWPPTRCRPRACASCSRRWRCGCGGG